MHRVITTVHGTFASGATWVQADSKLGLALTARFGPAVSVIPCSWSGRNNPAAREEGQQRLRRHLHTLLDKYPDAQHFVIAHSHGGNIALYALRDPELQQKLRGVACLATPFLVARRRVLGTKNVTEQVAGASIIPALFMFIAANLYLPAFGVPVLRELALTLLLIASFVVVAIFLRRWKNYAERLLPDLMLPSSFPREKLLLIRAAGDEAGAGLALVQFVSQLNVRVYLLLRQRHARVRDAVKRWAGRPGLLIVWLLSGLVAYFALIAAMITLELPLVITLIVVIVAAALLIGVPALALLGRTDEAAAPLELASYVVLFGVICALAVVLLPFGRQVAAASVFLDVTIETTPPGEWTVHLLAGDTTPGRFGELPPLQHSLVYDDDEAVRRISDWIEQMSPPCRANEEPL